MRDFVSVLLLRKTRCGSTSASDLSAPAGIGANEGEPELVDPPFNNIPLAFSHNARTRGFHVPPALL